MLCYNYLRIIFTMQKHIRLCTVQQLESGVQPACVSPIDQPLPHLSHKAHAPSLILRVGGQMMAIKYVIVLTLKNVIISYNLSCFGLSTAENQVLLSL